MAVKPIEQQQGDGSSSSQPQQAGDGGEQRQMEALMKVLQSNPCEGLLFAALNSVPPAERASQWSPSEDRGFEE